MNVDYYAWLIDLNDDKDVKIDEDEGEVEYVGGINCNCLNGESFLQSLGPMNPQARLSQTLSVGAGSNGNTDSAGGIYPCKWSVTNPIVYYMPFIDWLIRIARLKHSFYQKSWSTQELTDG